MKHVIVVHGWGGNPDEHTLLGDSVKLTKIFYLI